MPMWTVWTVWIPPSYAATAARLLLDPGFRPRPTPHLPLRGHPVVQWHVPILTIHAELAALTGAGDRNGDRLYPGKSAAAAWPAQNPSDDDSLDHTSSLWNNRFLFLHKLISIPRFGYAPTFAESGVQGSRYLVVIFSL